MKIIDLNVDATLSFNLELILINMMLTNVLFTGMKISLGFQSNNFR